MLARRHPLHARTTYSATALTELEIRENAKRQVRNPNRRYALNPPPNCAVDSLYGLGCIHGTIVDEGGKPITHIEVDLIPVYKTGDARWYGTHSEWTDDQGRYNLNRTEPGEYLLDANAFSSFGAPDAERPFATAHITQQLRTNRKLLS